MVCADGDGVRVSQTLHLIPCPPPQAPSEYETSPDQLFYRIAHLNRGQQYLLWVAAVTSAGRGNISEKVTIEPAGKGTGGCQPGGTPAAVPCPMARRKPRLGDPRAEEEQHGGPRFSFLLEGSAHGACPPG